MSQNKNYQPASACTQWREFLKKTSITNCDDKRGMTGDFADRKENPHRISECEKLDIQRQFLKDACKEERTESQGRWW